MKTNSNSKTKNLSVLFLISLLCGFILSIMRFQESFFLEKALYSNFEAYKFLASNSFIDIKASIVASVFLIPFALVLKKIRPIASIFFLIFIIVNGLLIKYFLTNFDLLGDEVLTFSLSEIFYIVGAEKNSVHIFDLSLVFFYPFLFVVLIYLLAKLSHYIGRKSQIILLSSYLFFLAASAAEYQYFLPQYSKFSSYQKYILNNNKATYFVAEILKTNKKNAQFRNETNLEQKINNYHNSNPQFNYINKLYPLVHNEDYPNVLGSYFKKKELKPNIVFLLVESLSRSFSGPDAHLGSFTPFLDSLKNESLYWENFFSNAERTYGVLPNVLSSAPYLNQFVSNKSYIKHSSIISELQKESYFTSFNYGGWIGFSSMDSFLNASNIDSIYGDQNFDSTKFNTQQDTDKKIKWGFDDKILFQQYLLRNQEIKEPFLSILLTISMHSPYEVAPEYTAKNATEYYGNSLTTYQQKLFKAHENKITAIAFSDQNLKTFFEEFKQQESFKNTIFVILGDHNIHSLPIKNELDIFHVPLFIYSDLLTKPQSFKGVSTHKDITPTLLGLLENNYQLDFNQNKHWLGYALDTSTSFRSEINTPMCLNSSKFINYIYKNNIVFKDEVFQFDSTLNITKQNDTAIANKVLKLYDDYSNIEKQVLKNNSLMN